MCRFEKALFAALCLAVLFCALQLPFSTVCCDIRRDTFRLHILANSDDAQDQQLKLKVRDAVLQQMTCLGEADSVEEARRLCLENLPLIERTARRVVEENGFGYDIKAQLTDSFFTVRRYDNASLPAGVYSCLKLEIGEGRGHNWWCVLYPAICVSAASERADGWDEQEQQVVYGDGYEVHFWIGEQLQKLAYRFKEKRES